MVPVRPGAPSCSSFYETRKPYPHPQIALNTPLNVPVHIDVGGIIHTSTLETLTAFPNSLLSKMFSGEVPIVLDTMKQHYFIDRDGDMFRHILNFMRHRALLIPFDFVYLDLLLAEANYFEIHEMVYSLLWLRNQRHALQFDQRNFEFNYGEQAEQEPHRPQTPTQP